MDALGKVVNVTRRGQALVRGTGKPRVGGRVADSRGRDVGRIQDIIGPVREPYIIVAPGQRTDARQLLGQELFMAPDGPPRQQQYRGGPPPRRPYR